MNISQIALSQRDPRWADHDLGEDPGGETIGTHGCLLTDLAMILRQVYRTNVTPPKLNSALARAGSPFVYDDLLAWETIAPLFSRFTGHLSTNRPYSLPQLRVLLNAGYKVILRYGESRHFKYLYDKSPTVIDPWTGKVQSIIGHPSGVRALKLAGFPPSPEIGLHDAAGGEWMRDNSIAGVCLAHHSLQFAPLNLDYRRLEDAGIRVICRLNWGYADGSGTLPHEVDAGRWITTIAETIKHSQGIWGWHIGNEINNPQEWPGWPQPSQVISPEYYTTVYNAIWAETRPSDHIAPSPLDPYNTVAGQYGQPGDPMDWASHIYSNIYGADFICLHAKTQTNNPAECWSREQFSHAPLIGRFLHLRTIEDQLSWIPSRFAGCPIYVTELNPQWIAPLKQTGWKPDNTEWIEKALSYLKTQPISGAIFYRFEAAGDQAPFGLEDKPGLLNTIRRLS